MRTSTDSHNSEFQWIKINVSPLSPAGFANLCRAVRGGTCISGFYDGVQDVKYGFFPLEICKKSKYLYFIKNEEEGTFFAVSVSS